MMAQQTSTPTPDSRRIISFYIPDEPDLETLARLCPDRDWQQMRRGQRWVLQTFLRLKQADLPVRLVRRPPEGGVLVYHAKHQDMLKKQLNGNRRTVLLGIRGDRKECYLAHFEVVQNSHWVDDHRRFFIPYWPQPNLIPRDSGRDARVERISFKGFDNNLHPFFFSRQWKRWLTDEGLEWVHHSMPHAPSEVSGVSVDWHDYKDVDVVVALRPPPTRSHGRRGHSGKPATKLYNAWHAGVPAILGSEYAYREVRRSELDYIEIAAPEEARDAIQRLRRDPDLYQAMVENCRQRAAEFDQQSITSKWLELLGRDIPAQLNGRRSPTRTWLPHFLRFQLNRLERVLQNRPSR